MRAGIELANAYCGCACIELSQLATWRGLDAARFSKLLMDRKSVPLPFEDPVSFAVNAARPITRQLSRDDIASIELLVIATESGIDFGKSMSSYVQHYLELSRNCRTFEVKHACYGGTAALQTACSFVRSHSSPRAKALVIATDIGRPLPETYAEPSQAAAAVALLISRDPTVFEVEQGASGCYGYEVMDTCRPEPDVEIGDPDLSMLSYLECVENSFRAFQVRTDRPDYKNDLDYIAMHTPFGGMVKGAHRMMMRKFAEAPPNAIEADFAARVEPSLTYCRDVGNIYSGTVFLALLGTIAALRSDRLCRIGVFSYGSGCCSEFYSGFAGRRSQEAMSVMGIGEHLAARTRLPMETYEAALHANRTIGSGTKTIDIEPGPFAPLLQQHFTGRDRLSLRRISEYHREYAWH